MQAVTAQRQRAESLTPIAPNTATYAGKFDGQGHTISGLYFNNEEEDYVGIFGQLRDGGEIQNVGLKNFTLEVAITSAA